MRRLGVGLIYLREVDPLYREGNPDLAVLELEPETFWEKLYPDSGSRTPWFQPNSAAIAQIAALPQTKLVHSVGFPVGGAEPYEADYVTPLIGAIRDLDAEWASAHLSFNQIATADGTEQIGFLLPPRQTLHGVELAAANITRLAGALNVPLAFETGVNYLRPRPEELSDGEFFGQVAEAADCGILLDLHNLWANERNGRQSVKSALDELPLERVWEIHLAGGMMLDGYYLDSHSGPIPDEVLGLAADFVPHMPNLGAMNFEVMPAYVQDMGLDGVREQIGRIADVWRLPRVTRIVAPRVSADLRPERAAVEKDVLAWEQTLGVLAVGHPPSEAEAGTAMLDDLRDDPAIGLFRRLIGEGRSGQISRALHYTTVAMLASWGPDTVHALLDAYAAEVYPDTFAAGEADRFARYVLRRLDRLPSAPYLAEILAFEHALTRASLYGEPAVVRWSVDPAELFASLDQGVMPTLAELPFEMQISPES